MPDKKILLVDDEELIRRSLCRDLKINHFDVETAASAEEAIAQLEEKRFDLVITDLMLGEMDGFQVLKKTKKTNPETSVIIFTGYGEMNSAIDALRLGADDYLLKPFDIQELLFRISRCLDKQELAKQLTLQKKLFNETLEKTHDLASTNAMLKKEIERRVSAEKALMQSEEALRKKSASLEETNTALKVLLQKREEDKVCLEEKVLSNINENVLPFLEKLQNSRLNDAQSAIAKIIETNLKSVLSKYKQGLTHRYLKLSPVEFRIIHFIKDGKTSKEIAESLNLSPRTIETHRRNIRKKIGITNQKTNLQSALASIQQ